MPNRWAVASGDWSNTATWNGGTLPTSADDVFANNFTVNVNQDIDVISLRNTATTGVNVGGTFNFNTANVTANISGQFFIAAANLCTITSTTGTVTINAPAAVVTLPTTGFSGNVIAVTGNCNFNLTAISLSTAGGTQNAQILNKTSGTGSLNIIANLTGGAGAGANVSQAVRVSGGSGVVNITGNLTGGTGGSASQAYVNSAGSITNITGNITGGTGQVAMNVFSQTNVIGTITGGSGSTLGVFVSAGTFSHIGTCQASATASAIGGNASASQTTILTGPFLRNGNNVAVASQSFTINSAYNPYFEFRRSNGTDVVYVDQSTLNFPAIADVRSGTTYASGLYTGTLAVPLPSEVLAGIPTDATTGTLLMTPQQFWDYLISSGFAIGSIGERLQNASTVATTGAQIASYNI